MAVRMDRIALFGIAASISILVSPQVTAASAQTGGTGSVRLAWNANPENDIVGYKIHLGTASGNYELVQDVGNETTATIPGLAPGTTYHVAVQAYNTAGLTSSLSSEISFSVSAGTGYDQWAGAGGLTGADALPASTPCHDGVPNLLKFAFNMNPSGPDTRVLADGAGTAGLPDFDFEKDGSGTWFTVEYLRRKGGGLVYSPKTSADLKTFVPMAGSSVTTDVDADFERVELRMPCDPAVTPKLFGRVDVTLP